MVKPQHRRRFRDRGQWLSAMVGRLVGRPRYLIPLLPWLVWPLGALIDHLLRCRWGVIVLIAASCVSTWLLTMGGQYYAPDDTANPLFAYRWPKILAGDVARNWGMIAGLRGGLSLLPLAIIIVGAFGATWYATRRKGQQPLA